MNIMDEFYLDGIPRMSFGAGKFLESGEIISSAGFSGKKALVVTGRSFAKSSGTLSKLTEMLSSAGINSAVFSSVSPNPLSSEADEGAKFFNDNECDFAIGLGGGSAMDVAKAISAVAASGGDVWEYIDFWSGNKMKALTRAYPIVTIPTRYGSGAEVSPFAVLTHGEKREKSILTSDLILPDLAIVDPEFCVTLDSENVAYGITDVLSHLLDTYISGENGSDVADSLTESLVYELVKNGFKAMEDLKNIRYHENIFYISMLALTGITQVGRQGDFVLHDLEHPLSAHFNIPHGLGLGALFPHLMKFSYEAAASRYSRLYRHVFKRLIDNDEAAFENFRVTDDEEEMARSAVYCFEEFLKILGTFKKLGPFGVTAEGIERMANDVIRLYGQGKLYINNPKKLRYSDIMEIYEKLI